MYSGKVNNFCLQENIHSQTGEWNWAAILQDYVSIKLPVIFCIERPK